MAAVSKITGREYKLFSYYGAEDAEEVIVTMGSVAQTIEQTVDYLQQHVHVGNVYVNRNMIGAVVGVQPFGGERLSGTGPKAGGPHYLLRMCTEKTLTINTTAAGGNATLMTLEEG